jgi:SprT protein
MSQERIEQVRVRVRELVSKANALYFITLPHINIRFDLRGRSAGQAIHGRDGYSIRFNVDMLANNSWNHILEETVPHELAHIVCFFDPRLGRDHNIGWQRVCRQLGGTGKRCHSEEITYAKGKTYYYTTTSERVVALSSIRHKRVQDGVLTYTYRNAGKIDRTCAYTTVPPG